VDDISFSVTRGEIFGFLGANGAGKTTTIRILCGLLSPTSGKGRVLDIDIGKAPERVKPLLGYMSQKFSLYPDLTVSENLELYGGLYGLSSSRLAQRRAFAVEMAGLVGQEAVLCATLPLGFKQRLALGAALLHEPKLLFLDEPTAGVAPRARREFWTLIRSLASSGTTVFVTSHYMDEVENCDRIVLMSRGRIAALGTPTELKQGLVGRIVRIECGQEPARLARRLRAHEGVVDAQPFGAAIHLIVAPGVDPIDHARKALAALEEQPRSVEVCQPTLEDVFISVVSGVAR
jgi:ABC-2 type transport system ATP-binding protein